MSNFFLLVCDNIINIDINNNLICYYVNKQSILNWLNIINFINYTMFKYIKLIIINCYYYIIQLYIIFIHSNMPNLFLKKYFYYFYEFNWYIKKRKAFIFKRYIKRRKLRRYYRFFTIGYLKILLLLIIVLIWFLMWKKHSTYYKRSYVLIALKFYFISTVISGIMIHLCVNHFISVIISLIISFIIVYLQLN